MSKSGMIDHIIYTYIFVESVQAGLILEQSQSIHCIILSFLLHALEYQVDYNNQEEICPLGHEWLSSIASSVEDRIITHHWAALILVLGSKERSWKQNLHQNVGQILSKHTKRIYLDLTKLKPIKCVVSGSNVCWPSLIPRSILIDQTCWTLHFPVHFSTTGHCSITKY